MPRAHRHSSFLAMSGISTIGATSGISYSSSLSALSGFGNVADFQVGHRQWVNAALRMRADYVDQILRGAKPGDLPIEQATEFDLIINQKAAKEIGLSIPQSVLLAATGVISK